MTITAAQHQKLIWQALTAMALLASTTAWHNVESLGLNVAQLEAVIDAHDKQGNVVIDYSADHDEVTAIQLSDYHELYTPFEPVDRSLAHDIICEVTRPRSYDEPGPSWSHVSDIMLAEVARVYVSGRWTDSCRATELLLEELASRLEATCSNS